MSDVGKRPLVTVIMPSYNHVKYVEQAIRSVWDQSYKNIELVVVDDFSNDGTSQLITDLSHKSPIPMVVFLKSKNSGISNSLNIGVSLSNGEWISILSSDDFFDLAKIEKQVNKAEEFGNDEYGCVHTDGVSVDRYGHIGERVYKKSNTTHLTGSCFDAIVYQKGTIITTSAMIKLSCVKRLDGFDENYLAEDFDFYLRLSRITKFLFLDEPLVFIRTSANSLGRQPWRWADNIFDALDKHSDLVGYDWGKIKAMYWLSIMQNFMEHGTLSQICRALIKSISIAWSSKSFASYLFKIALIILRAIAYRTKHFFRRIVSKQHLYAYFTTFLKS